jgi:uncharacterized protein YjdB
MKRKTKLAALAVAANRKEGGFVMKRIATLAALIVMAAMILTMAGCSQGQTVNLRQQATGLANEFLMELGVPSGAYLDSINGSVDTRHQFGEASTIQDGAALVRWMYDTGNRVQIARTNVGNLTALPLWSADGYMTELSGEVVYATGLESPHSNITVTVIAYNGALWQVSDSQPAPVVAQMMRNLVNRWGYEATASVTPWLRKDVKITDTMFGYISQSLWNDEGGKPSIYSFLSAGYGNWKPELVNFPYDTPWSTTLKWYENGNDMGTLSKGTPTITAFFPKDLSSKLSENDRCLLGFLDSGTVLAPRLSAAVTSNLGGGNGGTKDPTPTPTNPPVTTSVTSVVLSPDSASRKQGESLRYTITTNYTNGTSNWHSGTDGVLKHNGGANLTVNGHTITIADNAKTGDYVIYAESGGKKSNEVILHITKKGGDTVKATAITVSPTSKEINKGEGFQLTATVTPSNHTNSVVWTSNDTTVATVNQNGYVTAVKVGTAYIYADIDGLSASCVVTVKDGNNQQKTVSSITLTPGTASIKQGEYQDYTVTVKYSDGSTDSNATISVNATGLSVNGKRVNAAANTNPGTYTVTATAGGKNATAQLTVTSGTTQKTVSSIEISPKSATKKQGESQAYTVTVRYTDGSSDSNATIRTNGGSHGLSVNGTTVNISSSATVGAYQVWAEAGNKVSNYSSLTVQSSQTQKTISQIDVNPPTATVLQGGRREYSVNVWYTDGTKDTNATLKTSGGNAGLSVNGFFVNASSNATVGNYEVWAEAGNKKSNIVTLTVQSSTTPITSIVVSPLVANIEVGDREQFWATVTPNNATTKLTWRSSDTKIATVDPQSGLVTGVAPGTAYIYAEAEGKQHYGTVHVKAKTTGVPVTSVVVSPANITIEVGKHADLYATVNPSNASNWQVTWSSSNNGVATVGQDGRVTGVAEGTVTITATADGKSGTATVHVKKAGGGTVDPPVDTTDPPTGPEAFDGTIIERFDGTTNNTRPQTFVKGQDLTIWVNDYRAQQGKEATGWTTSTGGSGSLTGKDGGSFTVPAQWLSAGVKIYVEYRAIPGWQELPPPENIDGF